MIFYLFQHITHLLCKDGHFWGGEVCISLVGKQPNQVRIFPATLLQISSSLCDSNLKRGGFREYWLVFMYQVRNFPLCFYGSVAHFARDEILTSSAVVLVRYWLVFLNQVRTFSAMFLWFTKK